ncbi:aldehyde oxidase 5 [Boleophthalmus pectinirostris]|uniref:aldehyde oxidase 5 n=1 Tax=Boleophthalmus pectinirostris TaxID=150288 RepID=UPI000A1C3AD1|nr:aldehyde oxidase 5 [Boleophthalmus pectinirostris]
MAAPNELLFYINGKKIVEKNADPEEVLLSYLRRKVGLTGTKSACGGGGCGACTVMVSRYDCSQDTVIHYTVTACLQPIVTLHGAAVVTVEGIGSTKTKLHPVQERIAKAHGSQCGFCTPGMVMSMYTLLRNKPQPSMEDIREALAGNLCRCTGYRPIIDGFKTFCDTQSGCCPNGTGRGKCCRENGHNDSRESDISEELFLQDSFLPLDPTQDLIFPPELMVSKQGTGDVLCFRGDQVTLLAPSDLPQLLELKSKHPEAPLVLGNTTIGPKLLVKEQPSPLLIYAGRVSELSRVQWSKNGLSIGAGSSLSCLKGELERAAQRAEEEENAGYRALLQTLQCVAGKQIRNMATIGGNIVSANPKYDLCSVLAALDCTLDLCCKGGTRTVPLDDKLFPAFGKTILRPDEVLLSLHVPYSKPCEFAAAFRQAQRRELAFSFVNAGMKLSLHRGSNTIQSLRIFYGGVGPTLVTPALTCQQLVGWPWGEELLSKACSSLTEEIRVPASIPGGKAEYRKTLVLSFFYKFYMYVTEEMRKRGVSDARLPAEYLSALTPFKNDVPQGTQSFQLVSQSQPSLDPVGRPSMHCSGVEQATGEAKYYDDLPPVHGELFVHMVTSTRAHATIINIDPTQALQMPGAVTFISAADVPGSNQRPWFNTVEEIFAEKEVYCVGQIIGALVAESREQARRAAARIQVTYEDLQPVILTIQDAIKHDSYFEPKRKIERGDVDTAMGTAEHILESEIYMGGQEHFYMETQGLVAVPRGESDEMDLYVGTQHAALTQELVSQALGVSSNKITCHVKRLGGGFGGKIMKIAPLSAITAVAAHKTGKAVRCCLDRGDDMLITSGRHPFLGQYKVGYNSDGSIVAADITYYSNGGCTLEESAFIMDKALLHMDNAYRIPHLRGRGLVCRTHLPSYTAFRGFGGPQGLMVIESVLHEVAVRCGLPPEKVREVNMYQGDLCYTHHMQPFCPTNMLRCWDQCLQRAGYERRLQDIQRFNSHNRWKKRGIAVLPQKFGIGFSKGFYNQGAALVNIYKDGSVLVSHGGTEMGQGIHTKALQVASRVLKVPMSRIFIKETCTGNVPNATPSAASFGTDTVGMAVKDACEKLMRRLKPIMEKSPKNSWKQWVSEAYFEKINLSATGFFMGPPTHVDWEKGEGNAYYYFTFGACCSEVEIDCLTGDHKNIRTDLVMDVGKSINPALDIGQVEGAFVQGLGLYTIEELHFSPDGTLLTRGPSQYKIPALCDVPAELNVHLLAEAQNHHAIYMSKGVGEPPLFFGSTVFFAIKSAIAAARSDRGLSAAFPLSSPATAARIRMVCEDQFTHMASSSTEKASSPWSIDV